MGGEDLIPGLVRVMEERLGPFGRPLTTLMILAAALGVIAWGVTQVIDKLILPVIRTLPVGGTDAFSVADVQSVGGLVGIIMGALVAEFALSRSRRKREDELKREVERLQKRLDDLSTPLSN